MYEVIWDKETGGITLLESTKEGIHPEIRPVFREELKVLGFNRYWKIPETKAPLLWSSSQGRVYFYRGRKVAEVRGGAFFRKPQLIVYEKDLVLEPVNVPLMIQRNERALEDLAQRALDFIIEICKKYRNSFINCVAFSGGKDSWVVLDLVQRALPPEDYMVVFNDTDMELRATHESVARAREHYEHLRFYIARSHLRAEESWRLFGPPSRLLRWCCTVHKSTPTLLLLRKLTGSASKVMVFDGVRTMESSRRAKYEWVNYGAKHGPQINVSPILNWSAAEVFLYLLARGLPIHKGYRFGLSRVGCSVCPLASSWSGFILWRAFEEDCRPLLKVLSEYARACGRKEKEEIEEFIASQAWGARAGGRFLSVSTRVNITNTQGFTANLPEEKERELKKWLSVVGELWHRGPDRWEIKINGRFYRFFLKRDQTLRISLSENLPPAVKTLLRAAVFKAAFCVGCRACEAECPTGAISFQNGKVEWEKNSCFRCHHCLTFEERGCLRAKSLQISQGSKAMIKIHTYQTFGLREEWLKEFFFKGNFWGRNSLGNRQEESLRAWLRHAAVIDAKREITPLGEVLKRWGVEERATWEVLWVNLSRGSQLVRWFLEKILWGERLSGAQLVDRMGEEMAVRTRQNAASALLSLFEKTPLKFLAEVKKEKRGRVLYKRGTESVSPVGLLYALYRLAESRGRYHFELGELVHPSVDTPYGLFGLSEESLKVLLRSTARKAASFLSVDLVRDLKSIYLSEEISSLEVLNRISPREED